MASSSEVQRKQPGLDRAAWITAALAELSQSGLGGVRIEILARNLGVTKGSFYWHFKDRADLLDAMLDHWRQVVVVEVISRLNAIDDPQERYSSVMRLSMDNSPANFDRNAGTRMELAIRLWARQDARVRAALADANELRLNFIIDVLLAAGAPVGTARARAILIFSCVSIGADLLDAATLRQCEDLLLAVSKTD